MNTDEGQQRAANTNWQAGEMMLRAANMIQESINQLVPLLSDGYGNQLGRLLEAIERLPKLK